MSDEMELMKKQIKDNIKNLINYNKLEEARNLLNEYTNIVSEDVETYSIKAVIEIMDGKIDEAEKNLKDGLAIDNNNFDLNYNLGYVYEQLEEFSKALKYYKISLDNCIDQVIKKDLTSHIEKISSEHNIKLLEDKKKIAFFVKEGWDSFLGEIINGLSDAYEIKKIIVTDYKQIDEGMEWSDICWFEWCDELVAYGSKHSLANKKKIICRLHSYEAFTNHPSQINWVYVDKLILVAEHIQNYIVEKFNISKEKIDVIPNGIDIKKHTFKERKPGYNIAYVGYINYKKGPMLLLQAFKAIYDKDNRYKLYLAGMFQDDRDVLYFKQMIKEFGIEKNVFYEGWQDDLDQWLENKQYILCTSILETQNMSVMQAMVKGIKPIVHNFVGAKNIYDNKYIWNTIDQATKMIINNKYESFQYRDFVKENFSQENIIQDINKMINNISSTKKSISIERFDYAKYWNNRLNQKFDIEGVGYIGLGEIYNRHMYKIRFDILKYLIGNLYGKLSDKNILELGPGIGMFTDYFHKINPAHYKAIDIAKKSVIELKKKYKTFDFVQGDVSNSDNYEKNEYDLIFAADVLLHLTDEDKYKETISNMANSLKNDGYIIIFDPISMIGTKSESSHVSIRDINYIKEIIESAELEIVTVLPSAFFMNYPFDKKLLKENEDSVKRIFEIIQAVYGSKEISDKSKEELVQWLTSLEKQCLINNDFGVSQKVLVTKKKSNKNKLENISIKKIWDVKQIKIDSKKAKLKLLKNNYLNRFGIITKLEDDIKRIINLDNHFLNNNEVKPLVTVGIINYNCKKYLNSCVQSFLNQTYKNIEILLIDDCSTDGSKEMIEKLEREYDNIRGIYHEKNSGGASKGIQEIISQSRGKYFQWIASDDFVAEDAVEKFVNYLEDNSDKDYVYSDFNIVDENNNVYDKWKYKLYSHEEVVREVFNRASGVIPMNCLFRKSFFKEKDLNWIIYKGNDFSADTLNCLVYIKHGWQYGKLDEGVIYYRVHSQNFSHNIEKRIKTMVSIFDYIIENFSEEIYFSEIDWAQYSNTTQLKNYAIAQFYYNQIQKHISLSGIPGYVKGDFTKNDIIKYICVYAEEGIKYMEKGLNQGSDYYEQLLDLKKKYKEYMKEI